LPYHLTHAGHLPTPLIFEHSTGSITPLTSDTLLLSISSLISPTDEYILDLSHKTSDVGDDDKNPDRSLHQLTSWSADHIDGRMDGLVIEELWTTGADEWDVMSWVIKPAGFDSSVDKAATYPLAFFVHGGPQGAHQDIWSTRWNSALFAAQGYFVVAVNPTGSTGYGQEFCDKIKENWGGAPYKDLLASFFAALDKYPQVSEHAVASDHSLISDRQREDCDARWKLRWFHGQLDSGPQRRVPLQGDCLPRRYFRYDYIVLRDGGVLSLCVV